jgi:ATP-dependent 26S proteasome regulatory subunit
MLVLEDMDTCFIPREKDNNVMIKILSSSDGIIKYSNKKMIFTSNITKFSNIDEALIRSGRCFDAIEFRNLTRNESVKLLSKIISNKEINVNTLLPNNKKYYSVADIYKISNDNGITRYKKEKFKTGFSSD